MILGNPNIVVVSETTDIIGIRTTVLQLAWQPSANARNLLYTGAITVAEIEAEKPGIPPMPGGVMLIGEQVRQAGPKLISTWTFQGVAGDGKTVTFKDRKNSIDYSFEAGFAQVSIQRHPRFEELVEEYGGFPDNDGGRVIWPATLPSKAAAANGLGGTDSAGSGETNPMFGINEFFQMEGTYRFRYAERNLPASLLELTGKVFNNGLPGKAPTLKDGRNWLALPPTYRRRGTVFDITESYWLSGRGGWPEPVYSKAGGGSGSGFGGIQTSSGI